LDTSARHRVVIVGHGPSVLTGRGSVIDSMTVVRLKHGNIPDPVHWGSRTDYLCACSRRFDHGKHPFWLVEQTGLPKLTTGTAAVLEAKRRLSPDEIFVIGFDRVMHPDRPDPRHTWLAHDKWAEHRLMMELGVRELG
jgi:hypothetical protein